MWDYELDRRAAALSRAQHGAFSHQQIIRAGGTRNQIQRRVTAGLWIRCQPSVYVDPAVPYSWNQTLMVAILAYPQSVVSGRAAAALWELTGFRACRPEITVPTNVNARGLFAIVHRSTNIVWTRLGALPIVRPEQAIIEIARWRTADELGGIVDDALHGPLRLERLGGRYAQVAHTRWPGLGKVRDVLTERDDGYVPPESELERLLYALLDGPGMPDYLRQAPAPWWSPADERVDALMPSAALIIEADGRRWHTRVRDFANDERRNNLAAAHGYRVMRFGWEDLTGNVGDQRALILAAVAGHELRADRVA